MSESVALPPKKAMMLALLERSSVFIYLDPRGEDVRVPPWFKKQPQLVLQVGLNMAVRIPDLAVEDDAVSCTLSFSRSPFFCYVPFSAVFALFGEDGKGMIWPGDVPKEVAAQQAEQAAKQAKLQQKPELAAVQAAPEPEPAKARPARKRRTTKADGKAEPGPSESRPRAASPGRAAGKTSKRIAPGEKKAAAKGAPETRGPVPPVREAKRPLPPYLRVVK